MPHPTCLDVGCGNAHGPNSRGPCVSRRVLLQYPFDERAQQQLRNSKDANFDVSFSSDKIETSGDLAYSRGRFTEKHSDAANKPVSTSGSYITVYKKQADGSWKVVEDFTAAEPAAAPAAAAPGQ